MQNLSIGKNGIRLVTMGACLAAVLLGSPTPTRAVILYGSATRNTSAPTGALGGSGWQYQGEWRGFLGTAIAPSHFITAGHVGGAVDELFFYEEKFYKAVEVTYSPESDLCIVKVDGVFTSYAPLYTAGNEVGQGLVVIGRGTPRGSEVRVKGVLKGWTWGDLDRVQSWGQNVVSSVEDGGAGLGPLLRFTFDAKGLANEGALSAGDSGGGLFIQQDGVWSLAGINYGVDGAFSYTGGADPGFDAAIFDERGLYIGGPGAYQYVSPRNRRAVPTGSYATRISANLAFIRSVTGLAAN